MIGMLLPINVVSGHPGLSLCRSRLRKTAKLPADESKGLNGVSHSINVRIICLVIRINLNPAAFANTQAAIFCKFRFLGNTNG